MPSKIPTKSWLSKYFFNDHIHSTSDPWQLKVQLAGCTGRRWIVKIVSLVKQIKAYLGKFAVDIERDRFRFEFSCINDVENSYILEIRNTMSLIANDSSRKKRGLINSGGTVLKILFGTLDDQDLELINIKLQKLVWISQDLYDQLRIMKDTNSSRCWLILIELRKLY